MNVKEGLQSQVKWLVLMPTRFEASKIESRFSASNVQLEICGFGPIVPAAKAVQLINVYRPRNVLLVGIAGSYGAALEVGRAYRFSSVTCDGIGAGEGTTFQTAQSLGWSQGSDCNGKPIGDSITFDSQWSTDSQHLLTVCSAAGKVSMANSRLNRFPSVAAEDMEGFGVAAACQICDVGLKIVRGISNLAGDREKSNWKVSEALNSAANLALEIMESEH